MSMNENPRLFVLGGLSGIVGTGCYVIAAFVSMNAAGTYAAAMAWPVLSIVFLFSLYRFTGMERPSVSNQLALVFACLAFTIVAAMLSVQLAVVAGTDEYIANSPVVRDQELLKTIRRTARLVDMGLDVAWDIFIGTALVFLAAAIGRHPRFGPWWAFPSGLLGVCLIVLNVITFPWPPNTRELFDIGPVIALFIIALSVRLLLLGNQMRKKTALPLQ